MTDDQFEESLAHWKQVFTILRAEHPSPFWDVIEKAFIEQLYAANDRKPDNGGAST